MFNITIPRGTSEEGLVKTFFLQDDLIVWPLFKIHFTWMILIFFWFYFIPTASVHILKSNSFSISSYFVIAWNSIGKLIYLNISKT